MKQYFDETEDELAQDTGQTAVAEEPDKDDSRFGDTLLEIFSYLLALPLFLLAIHIVPDFDWIFNLDRILLFIITISIVQKFIDWFRPIVLIALVIGLGYLCYNSFINKNPYAYGWGAAFNDYTDLVYATIGKELEPTNVFFDVLNSDYAIKVQNAAEYRDSSVAEFAQECIKDEKFAYFADRYEKYATAIKSFAIFKVINEKWEYQPDADGTDIPAKASKTVHTFKGDCEDHAILMASSIKAIGGTVRIVISEGHAYPELCIGDKTDFENLENIIKLELFPDTKGRCLHTHEEKDKIWLNLDYTENFPGGRFLNDNSKKLSVVRI